MPQPAHGRSAFADSELRPTREEDNNMAESDVAEIDVPAGTSARTPTPIVSLRPIVLPAPGRGEDVQVRVSAPAVGNDLPIIVFSHGFGESMVDYAPLVDFWAAEGFAVIQPTHLDSRTLALTPGDSRTPRVWRFRIEDLTRVLDDLEFIEASVPGLSGRLDHNRIAIAGHSWGATTASALLGARILDADGNVGEDMSDSRITAGVLLCLAGAGGDGLTPFAAENYSFMNPSFDEMRAPALMVAGDNDQSMLSTRGPDWWTDAYAQSPAKKSLLTLFGSQHTLGGVTGYGVTETTDENPARVALLRQLTSAYFHSIFDPQDARWSEASNGLAKSTDPLGRLESK
jgi:pimeloyl-ACP methyl ester carboxylesterase